MRLHFENNIFVVSRSPRARPFAFNHLETLVLRGSYKETFRRGPHNVNKFKVKWPSVLKLLFLKISKIESKM